MKPEDVERLYDVSVRYWIRRADTGWIRQFVADNLAPLVDEIVREAGGQLSADMLAAATTLGCTLEKWPKEPAEALRELMITARAAIRDAKTERDPSCGHLLAEREERRKATSFRRTYPLLERRTHDAGGYCRACERERYSRCANCGKPVFMGETFIVGGIFEEGEGACSQFCYDEYDERGCPQETGGYRDATWYGAQMRQAEAHGRLLEHIADCPLCPLSVNGRCSRARELEAAQQEK